MTAYKDLLAQREALNKQIEEARKTEIESAIAKARELVAEYGLTADDVFAKAASKAGKKIGTVAPKYRDPQTGATWTGRGREPLWIAGKNRSSFTI